MNLKSLCPIPLLLSVSALPPNGEGARRAAVLERQRRGAGHSHGHYASDDGGGRSHVFDVSSEGTRGGVQLKKRF